MRHETFHDTDQEAALWAASSVQEHHSSRSIKEPWLAALIFVVAAMPLIWEPAAWLFAPLFAAMLLLRLGALVAWRDRDDPEPAQWPTLTILLPVYREPSVIADLAAAMRALDYPSPEIVLLVEADDHETRAVLDCWPYRVLVVPDGHEPFVETDFLILDSSGARTGLIAFWVLETRGFWYTNRS